MQRPTLAVTMEVGDSVQARFLDPTDQPVVNEFVVTGIDKKGVVTGAASVLGPLDPALGWTFEVFRKGNLVFPGELAAIAVVFAANTSTPVKMLGEGTDWQRDGGGRVSPDELATILAWVPWSQWAATLAPYTEWKTALDLELSMQGIITHDSEVV